MTMSWLEFEPVDAWTFRDGRPGSGDQAHLPTLFPPPPMTMVGAIRAALAREMGWRTSEWTADVKQVLGDGPDDLGQLKFTGSVLLRGGEAYFPCPWCVMVEEGKPVSMLSPASPEQACMSDLGRVRLPVATSPTPGMKEPDGWWISKSGLESVLQGKLPTQAMLLHSDDLFVVEQRVGLELNYVADQNAEGATGIKTAKPGRLYSPQFVRLRPGVTLAAGVAGLESANVKLPSVFPMGGEGRLSSCRSLNENPLGFNCPKAKATNHAIHLLSPALFTDNKLPKPGIEIASGLTLVSMCSDRPGRLGGWNSVKDRSEPQRPVLNAGTVLFVEGDSEAVSHLVDHGLGERTSAGFGMVVRGDWPNT